VAYPRVTLGMTWLCSIPRVARRAPERRDVLDKAMSAFLEQHDQRLEQIEKKLEASLTMSASLKERYFTVRENASGGIEATRTAHQSIRAIYAFMKGDDV
jgi:hypothetical protein